MEVEFIFDQEKDQELVKTRNISFKEVIKAIGEGGLLDVISNPQRRYKHQKIYVVKLYGYVYLVPFVMEEHKIFLKTAYPSRKAVKKYLKMEEA